jgi:hypothetical protein
MQAAATWLLECPDVAKQQAVWQKAIQEDRRHREAAAQKEKEARRKLISKCVLLASPLYGSRRESHVFSLQPYQTHLFW